VDTGSYYSFNLNMTDDRGAGGSRRQLMHGWIKGPPSPTEDAPYWQGTHSVPRVLSIRGGDLWQEPIPEIAVLRRRHHRFVGADIEKMTGAAAGHAAAQLLGVRGDALEVVARFGADAAGRFGLKLRVPEDRTDYVCAYFERATGAFGVDGPTVDQTAELTDEKSFKNRAESNDSQLSSDEPVTLRILLDRSVIEVFVNGRAISTQMFPAADAQGVEVFAENGILQTPIESIDIYEMSSIWSGGGAQRHGNRVYSSGALPIKPNHRFFHRNCSVGPS
jgi:sucrose-6-phosphate hydrolase SacC (GH32 family)